MATRKKRQRVVAPRSMSLARKRAAAALAAAKRMHAPTLTNLLDRTMMDMGFRFMMGESFGASPKTLVAGAFDSFVRSAASLDMLKCAKCDESLTLRASDRVAVCTSCGHEVPYPLFGESP